MAEEAHEYEASMQEYVGTINIHHPEFKSKSRVKVQLEQGECVGEVLYSRCWIEVSVVDEKPHFVSISWLYTLSIIEPEAQRGQIMPGVSGSLLTPVTEPVDKGESVEA